MSQLAEQAVEMARLAEGAPMAIANIKSLVETVGYSDFSSHLDRRGRLSSNVPQPISFVKASLRSSKGGPPQF